VVATTAITDWLTAHLAQPWLLTLAALVPLLWLHWWRGNRRRRRDLRQWLGEQPLLRLPYRRPGRFALGLAVLCLVIVNAEPLWGTNPHVESMAGRDLFVVLDVSRSMLAEDRPPRSRLDRAKRSVRELLDHLQSRGGGHRVGIILFAGRAKLVCPLTADYDHLRFALAQAHPDQLGSERLTSQEPQVGTSYGPAVELALQQPELENRTELDFLLITDGDDLAGDAAAVAVRMQNSKTHWHLYGVGETKETWIPSGNPTSPFMLVEDPNDPTPKRATTQRRDDVLQRMANISRATLLLEDATTQQPLVQWWQRSIPERPSAPWLSDPRSVKQHQYAWFLGAALVLLVFEMFWGEGRFRSDGGRGFSIGRDG
jgi:Ca-activated chloride channel homolog